MDQTPKMGKIRRGWELAKSSWHVLKLDKELAVLPALSMALSLFGLLVLAIVGILVVNALGSPGESTHVPGWLSMVGTVFFALFLTLVTNFFGGAVVYGATQRFRGGNPTVGSSLAGARAKFGSLFFFSLMMATVGLVLQTIEERVPLAARIATRLVGAAWAVANVFAVPVIVLSEVAVAPLQATRQSVAVIKKVWGEGVVVQLGIGLIGFLSMLGYAIISIALSVGVFSLSTTAGLSVAILAFFGLVALLLILATLTSIAKAALYFYATTGQAPGTFDQNLLQNTLVRKKRFGFGKQTQAS